MGRVSPGSSACRRGSASSARDSAQSTSARRPARSVSGASASKTASPGMNSTLFLRLARTLTVSSQSIVFLHAKVAPALAGATER